MASAQTKVILWTGAKHSGKTIAATRLAEKVCDEGFTTAGVLAPSIYLNGKLVGFDLVDLQTKKRISLVYRENKNKRFTFTDEGLRFGKAVLNRKATESAQLIIIDEFGPLELKGGGWRQNIDSLLTSAKGILLIVAREELANRVQQLYSGISSRLLRADDSESIDKVISMLQNQYRSRL